MALDGGYLTNFLKMKYVLLWETNKRSFSTPTPVAPFTNMV